MKGKTIIGRIKPFLIPLLALIGCATLLALGTVSVSADEPSSHTDHRVCGGTDCTHAGTPHTVTVAYTPLTQSSLGAMQSTNELNDPAYELLGGNYCLVEDITADYPIYITDKVNLCLNGYTITMAEEASIHQFNDIFQICDCSPGGTGTIMFNTSVLGIIMGSADLADKQETVLNLYGGELTNSHSLGGGIRVHHSDIGIYGGTVRGKNDFALEVYGSSRVEIGGGTVNSVSAIAVGLYVREFVAPSLRILGGSVIGYQEGVRAQSATVEMQGGTVEGYNAGMHLTLGCVADFDGGKLKAKGKATTDAGLRIEGDSIVHIRKLTIESKSYGIYTGIAADVTMDPAEHGDVRVTATTNPLYMKDGQVAADGKVVIDGGTYQSTDSGACVLMKAGTLEINGGLFQGNGFSIDLNPDNGANAYLTVNHNPTFDNRIRLWRVGVDKYDAYYSDFSGYTGEGLTVVLPTSSITLANDLIVAKGNAEKLSVSNTGWMLVDGIDTAEPPRRVVRLMCAGHKGGEPTCVTPAECTTCKTPYTLPHTFGEWMTEIPATCAQTGMVAHKDCSVCGKHFNQADEEMADVSIAIDATAHSWGAWTQTTAPTCTAEGTETRACAHDSTHTETRSVAIDATAHSWGAWTQTTAPTCTAEGTETRACAHDSTHTETRGTAALGHAFGEEYLCDEAAHWHTCTRCGEADAKVAHTFDTGRCVCGYQKADSSGCKNVIGIASLPLLLLIGCFSLVSFVKEEKEHEQ